MPLLLHEYLEPEGELGLWRIQEPESWFRLHLHLHPAEEAQLAQIKGRRRVEWLAGRWLLHHMSGRSLRGACVKDEFGKPHLEGSLYDISMSHSHELAAVIASPRAVGVDIQFLVEKIGRIAHKFMRPVEMACLHPECRLEHLHVFWGAKECLYKAHGRRQLDFRRHIHIDPFVYVAEGGEVAGHIRRGEEALSYRLFYRLEGEYMLVYGWEDIGDVRIA